MPKGQSAKIKAAISNVPIETDDVCKILKILSCQTIVLYKWLLRKNEF